MDPSASRSRVLRRKGPLPCLFAAALIAAWVVGSSCAGKGNIATSPQAPGSGIVEEMRAACKGWLRADGEKHRFEVAYALRPPDSLYAEFSGRVGGTQAILTVSRGRLLVLIPAERQFFEEEATPATFDALFGLRLSATDLVSILGSVGLKKSFSIADETQRLVVRVDEERLRVEPLSGAHGFQGLELKYQEIDRPPEVPIEESLFDVPVPGSFERIALDPNGAGPLLLP